MQMNRGGRAEQGPKVVVIEPVSRPDDPVLASMNFLNEAAKRYPNAVSFAAGRPPDHLVSAQSAGAYLTRFTDYRVAHGATAQSAWTTLGQYSDTGGIIKDLIAEYLAVEENVEVRPGDCVITNGFQEALFIHLLRLRQQGGAIIARDPTYSGLTGAAITAGVPVFAVSGAASASEAIAAGAAAAFERGFKTLAAYVIADYANPSGDLIAYDERLRVLQTASRLGITVIEDAAYRVFSYEDDPPQTLLALGEAGRVVHLGTFSKMFLPGVRVGFSVVKAGGGGSMTEDLLVIKSFNTVATSPIAQAIAGGFLLDVDFKVKEWNRPRIAYCRANRDAMLAALEQEFSGVGGVEWSRPGGGFFIVVTVPARIMPLDLGELADKYGVIVTPMSFFSAAGTCDSQIRLAFSNCDPDGIRLGVRRFAQCVKDHLNLNVAVKGDAAQALT